MKDQYDSYQKGPGVSKIGQSLPKAAEEAVRATGSAPKFKPMVKSYEMGTVKIARSIKK